MKQITAALKPLFNELRNELRTEINGVRAEMHAGFAMTDQKIEKLGSELKGVTRRTAIHVAKLVGDVADIKHTMASTMAAKDDISLVHSRLDQHERRLSRLEGRRS